MGHGLQPVAQYGRLLEVKRIGGGLHATDQLLLQLMALAGEKAARLLHHIEIIRPADQPDAGTGAALDLILQAGAGAVLEFGIRAGAEREQPLESRQCLIDCPGGGEGAEIFALAIAGAAVLCDLRPVMITGDQDIGEGFVIAQDDVVARLQILDQVGFQQQRLYLRMGGDEFHRPGEGHHPHDPARLSRRLDIGADALFEVLRLANIQNLPVRPDHPVYPGTARQSFQKPFDHLRPAAEGGAVVLMI